MMPNKYLGNERITLILVKLNDLENVVDGV